jgi:hypothetical protein
VEPFQERVVLEQAALEDKLVGLQLFIEGEIYAGLPIEEKERLHRQELHMREYNAVLIERIQAFTC